MAWEKSFSSHQPCFDNYLMSEDSFFGRQREIASKQTEMPPKHLQYIVRRSPRSHASVIATSGNPLTKSRGATPRLLLPTAPPAKSTVPRKLNMESEASEEDEDGDEDEEDNEDEEKNPPSTKNVDAARRERHDNRRQKKHVANEASSDEDEKEDDEFDDHVYSAPALQEYHDSWKTFLEYVEAYEKETQSSLRVKYSNAAKKRNKSLREQVAAQNGEFVRFIPTHKTWKREYLCTH